ncbi:MAG: AbrB/MazE/SpoVT family DNA-binding domain-containing protein [Spirochaetes bacterium]|nr:AbrB/MazE/SpoVT family DNA-binding domain-containing protein [Spirochaetota bacterium]
MRTKIIKIGNSKGIRIPNTILKVLGNTSTVDMLFDEKEKKIIVKPAKKAREGWDEQFKQMNKNNHDVLLIDDSLDTPDFEW